MAEINKKNPYEQPAAGGRFLKVFPHKMVKMRVFIKKNPMKQFIFHKKKPYETFQI